MIHFPSKIHLNLYSMKILNLQRRKTAKTKYMTQGRKSIPIFTNNNLASNDIINGIGSIFMLILDIFMGENIMHSNTLKGMEKPYITSCKDSRQ
jgi:hypothetical protein